MKKLKVLLMTVITLTVLGFGFNANAQSTNEFKQQVIAELNKQLPMDVQPGMVFTKASIDEKNNLMNFTFSINPTTLGVEQEMFKTVLKSFTPDQIRELVGTQMTDMLSMFQCDGRMILVFPDKSEVVLPINR